MYNSCDKILRHIFSDWTKTALLDNCHETFLVFRARRSDLQFRFLSNLHLLFDLMITTLVSHLLLTYENSTRTIQKPFHSCIDLYQNTLKRGAKTSIKMRVLFFGTEKMLIYKSSEMAIKTVRNSQGHHSETLKWQYVCLIPPVIVCNPAMDTRYWYSAPNVQNCYIWVENTKTWYIQEYFCLQGVDEWLFLFHEKIHTSQ